jgi:succinylarginine dihydrolase
MEQRFFEANFDGLVGPTHNYGGLAFGNVASMANEAAVSNPREGAIQGLEKMKFVRDLLARDGLVLQGVLPPQDRPDLSVLRRLGFSGSDGEVLDKAYKTEPRLLAAVYSSSAMWAANAATIAPSPDTADGRVHFTPANLNTNFHRAIEPEFTARSLKRIFAHPAHFKHHDPLPGTPMFGDEGAANHTRLTAAYGKKGLHFYVYGKDFGDTAVAQPKKFVARQTYEASRALARQQLASSDSAFFAHQLPDAIDAGVFHNDVAGVGNLNVYFCHEKAYSNQAQVLADLKRRYREISGEELSVIEVPDRDVSMMDAVKSYLFNSQLLAAPGGMTLIAPKECEETKAVHAYLRGLLSSGGPIRQAHFLDVRQSMRNGGGPACLRLRVVLSEKELAACHQGTLLTDKLLGELQAWAKKHYRDRLAPNDLLDPNLIRESHVALDELTQIMGLGSLYDFQKA